MSQRKRNKRDVKKNRKKMVKRVKSSQPNLPKPERIRVIRNRKSSSIGVDYYCQEYDMNRKENNLLKLNWDSYKVKKLILKDLVA